MKKSVVALTVLASFSFASLINTTDQVNRQNVGLGGNPAAKAFNKDMNVDVGATALTFFNESGSMLDSNEKIKDTGLGLLDDMYGSYTTKYMDGYLTFGYDKSKNNRISETYKLDDAKVETSQISYTEKISATYGYDVNKNLAMGAKVAIEKNTDKYLRVANSQAGGSGSSYDYATESDRYTTLTVGGIYTPAGDSGKITFAQKFNPTKKYETTSGKVYGDTLKAAENYESDLMQNVTSVGYIYNLSDKINLAGNIDMVWGAAGTVVDASQTSEKVLDKEYIGYNKYSLNGEYVLSKDTAIQGYYAWANGIDQYKTDSRVYGSRGYNETVIGANIVKDLNADQTVVGGISMDKIGILDTDKDLKDVITETKIYGGLSMKL